MKDIEILIPIRRVNDFGKVSIPKEIREYFEIKENDRVRFSVQDGKIVIEKVG